MEIAESVNKVPIRLTDERWVHIVENHDELAGMAFDVLDSISNPDLVVDGWKGECLAVKKLNKRHLVVVYKEVSNKDGFVITAFLTSRIHQVKKRKILWQKQS